MKSHKISTKILFTFVIKNTWNIVFVIQTIFYVSILNTWSPRQLGWSIALLLHRCEAIWTERSELSNWIAAIFIAGMAEGFWAGCSLEDGSVNCDPGSLSRKIMQRWKRHFLCSSLYQKTCKKLCCTSDCKKVVIKASKWNAKDKNIQLTNIIDIIAKASLMEAVLCRRNNREAEDLLRKLVLVRNLKNHLNDIMTCRDFGLSRFWLYCRDRIPRKGNYLVITHMF
jgi:hypothetical protein